MDINDLECTVHQWFSQQIIISNNQLDIASPSNKITGEEND